MKLGDPPTAVSDEQKLNQQLPELSALLCEGRYQIQHCADNILTLWINTNALLPALSLLKSIKQPFTTLFDLYGIDERLRLDKDQLPCKDFTGNLVAEGSL